ncbi:unnamed protein product [Lota lota]
MRTQWPSQLPLAALLIRAASPVRVEDTCPVINRAVHVAMASRLWDEANMAAEPRPGQSVLGLKPCSDRCLASSTTLC